MAVTTLKDFDYKSWTLGKEVQLDLIISYLSILQE
jgi:hypothetical protein